MTASDYLDRLLVRYSGMFDIYQPYRIEEEEYPAYGYFFSHNEKYVLIREANLWTVDSFEHMLFDTREKITIEDIDRADRVIREYMEPVLVCKGEKMPEKNHMYSYLTFVFIVDQAPDPEVIRKVKKYKFEKGYQFNIRGYSSGRMVLVDISSEKVYTNDQARKGKKLFVETFEDVKKGKITFSQLCEKHEITPFTQELERERKGESREKADIVH